MSIDTAEAIANAILGLAVSTVAVDILRAAPSPKPVQEVLL